MLVVDSAYDNDSGLAEVSGLWPESGYFKNQPTDYNMEPTDYNIQQPTDYNMEKVNYH